MNLQEHFGRHRFSSGPRERAIRVPPLAASPRQAQLPSPSAHARTLFAPPGRGAPKAPPATERSPRSPRYVSRPI